MTHAEILMGALQFERQMSEALWKHRNAWRRHAYGAGVRPTDKLSQASFNLEHRSAVEYLAALEVEVRKLCQWMAQHVRIIKSNEARVKLKIILENAMTVIRRYERDASRYLDE